MLKGQSETRAHQKEFPQGWPLFSGSTVLTHCGLTLCGMVEGTMAGREEIPRLPVLFFWVFQSPNL